MKIVIFRGGLGNQIFEYAFYKHLCNKSRKEKIYAYYIKEKGGAHNLFELDNYFNIDILYATFTIKCVYWIIRIFNKTIKSNRLISSDNNLNYKSICFDGWWQDAKFYNNENGNRRFASYKKFDLSERNLVLIDEMQKTESISIHIRRGDYLLPKYINVYGNVCTLEYYAKAIDIIRNKFLSPHFYIFSNDIKWVLDNLNLDNATYVDWNVNGDSFYDMYLMSQCKANIIANSSFSYWGAFFNENKNVVIYPRKWYNSTFLPPLIFPKTWIGI